jgi:hypothetical protein
MTLPALFRVAGVPDRASSPPSALTNMSGQREGRTTSQNHNIAVSCADPLSAHHRATVECCFATKDASSGEG